MADKGFHLDTYCFDSMPELDFFLNVIQRDAIKDGLSYGNADPRPDGFLHQLHCPGYAWRASYYQDFSIQTKNGDWLVVEVKARNMMDDRDVLAKQTIAETMLKASKISYHMVAHTDVCGCNAVSHTKHFS